MNVSFLIAVIYLTAASAADVTIECEYGTEPLPQLNVDDTLTCDAIVKIGSTDSKGSEIKIIPIDEVQRFKVEHFRLKNQDISSYSDDIIKAIATNFPKLKGLVLANASISHVSKDNLKSLPELVLLNLGHNKIEVLESDLFAYTPKLQYISFDFNLISSVDDKLLNSLDVITADFDDNPCIKLSTCKSQENFDKLAETNPVLFAFLTVVSVITED